MNHFKDKVVYQIYPKSFADANGDGIGDLKGVVQKLDYVKNLRVDYIWLTPFFLSPQRDNGYDVADYYRIDPMFGTMQDFEALVAGAKQRGIGIMLDMVFNHTSTEHEWFKRAIQGEEKYQDYYIFREGSADKEPTNWQSKFGGNAWEYVPQLKKWYLHLFDKTQADLNWENPAVREELKKIILFWKEKGVEGFRFDVVNLISKPKKYEDDLEGDGRKYYTDGVRVHDYLKELVKDTGIESMITVGEMSSTSLSQCIKYTNPNEKELSMTFSFHHLKVDYKDGNKWEIQKPDYQALKNLLMEWQLGMQEADGWNAVFWCNHDQPRIVSRFGDDKKYWKESAKMLATCIHMLRGTPYIYQGEELGMTNAYFSDLAKYRDVESTNYYQIMREAGKSHEEAIQILQARSRDNARTPMQWNGESFAGFSTVTPWIEVQDNYLTVNAKSEEQDQDSILQYYKELIALRKKEAVIATGSIRFLYQDREDVFAYCRADERNQIVVLNNLSDKQIILENEVNEPMEKLLGNYEGIQKQDDKLVLRPYESAIFKLRD